MPLESITVRVGEQEVGLLHGGGRAPALLFFHGAGHGAAHLRALAEAIPEREVFVLDAPGRGESGGPPLEAVGELAALGAEVMRALGRPEWIACGHSLGGAVALECGLSPGPKALVLLASGARLRVSPFILERAREALSAGRAAETFEPAYAESDAEALDRIRALDEAIPPRAALADWRAADGFDRMTELGSIELPTLVVTGTEDPLTPEKYARYLAEHLPRAELVRLEGAGHMFPLERPREAAEAIARFVARLSREGA